MEMLELAEGLLEKNLLMDRHVLAVHLNRFDPELGLAAGRRCMREDFETRGNNRPHRVVTRRDWQDC